jgi:low affinity Fe/Cu permease
VKKINERFLALADAVSFGMGTPTNILFWILAVAIWILLGAFRQEWFIDGNFLPAWFTSTAWNFPLNTVTTLAELYIGFLVAAAANRAERELRKLIESVKKTLEKQDEILAVLVKYQEKELAKENQVLQTLKKR